MGGYRRIVGALTAALCAAAAPASTAAPAASWAPTLPVSQQSQQMLSAFPNGTGFVFDKGSAITLWHTATYGVAWDALTYLPPAISQFASIRFASPTVGYALDIDRLLQTRDGATTPSWRPLATPPLAHRRTLFAQTLGVTGSTVAVAGDVYAPLHNGCNSPVDQGVWTTHNDGRHWTFARLPRNTSVRSIDYLDAKTGVLVAYRLRPDPAQTLGACTLLGDRDTVFVTRNGGHTFHQVLDCAAKPGELCTAAKFFTASTIFVGRNDGTTAVSHDAGRTFAAASPLRASIGETGRAEDNYFWVQGFDFAGQVGYATTKLGGAFRTTDFGKTWTREASCDSAFSLGIGDIAAFDANRVIAGGPTCVAARTGVGAAMAATRAPATAPARTGHADVRMTAGHRVMAVRGGVLFLRR